MPTGYTAPVKDGTITDFPTFAMQCARAFGALVEMRDAAPDAQIPDHFAPSPYHAERAAAARARLEELRAMPFGEVERLCAEDNAKRVRERDEFLERRDLERQRYEAMLAKVQNWQPPTPDHVELKAFMVQQMEESIRFDCDLDWAPDADPLEPHQWLAREIVAAGRQVETQEEEHAKEVERAARRTAWVKALRESLGAP